MKDLGERIARIEHWLTRIGNTLDQPVWDRETETFVYREVTPKHVAYLKAVRAVSSLHSLPLLYAHGMLIDGGTIVRCINEALSEIYFILKDYPAAGSKVNQFVAHFLATSPSTDEKEAPPVKSRKIHSAEARLFENQLNFNDALEKIRNVYVRNSGYVHARYPHIMEIYGGRRGDWKFNTSGVLGAGKRRFYAEQIDAATTSTEVAIAFMAAKLGLADLVAEIRESLTD